MEFARYSIDYHYVRNWLYVNTAEGKRWKEGAERAVPTYVTAIMGHYDRQWLGDLRDRCRVSESTSPGYRIDLSRYPRKEPE